MNESITTVLSDTFSSTEAGRKASADGLLSLPAEIRLKILFYALHHPESFVGDEFDPKTIIMRWIRYAGIGHREENPRYWGSERYSRLLRVSKQIHDEAEEVLYKHFIVEWPLYACTCTVREFLAKRSPQFRAQLRHINVRLSWIFHSHSSGLTAKDHRARQYALCESLAAELPSLHSIKFLVSLAGRRSLSGDVKIFECVDDLMRPLGIFRAVKQVELSVYGIHGSAQKSAVIRIATERIRRGEWGERSEPSPESVCCPPRMKAARYIL